MSSTFIDSVKSERESGSPYKKALDDKNNLSEAEVRLIQSAVGGEKQRKEELSSSETSSEDAGVVDKSKWARGESTPSTTASDAPSCASEGCDSGDDDDTYHKPDKKKYKMHKHTPWVWIAVLIIVVVAILYSWYDYTKQNNSRKDVRAFVAAIIIVIGAVLLYMLVR